MLSRIISPYSCKAKEIPEVKEKRCPKKRPKKEYSQGTLIYELQICDEAHPSYPTAPAQASVLIGMEGLQSGCLHFAGCPVPCCMTTASLALVASRTAKLGKNGIVAGCGNSSSPSTQAPKPKSRALPCTIEATLQHPHHLHHLSHYIASISSSPFIMFFLFTCGSHSTSPLPLARPETRNREQS